MFHPATQSVKHTLDVFRAKHRKSRAIYSFSSMFYAAPAIALLYNYPSCVEAVSGNVVLINVMITQLFVQCPLSYLNDTYSLWKYYSFHQHSFWGYADVSAACMTFVSQLIMTPQLCETHFELALYVAGLVASLGFFVIARITSQSKHFTTNTLYKWAWLTSHTMWHTILPAACTYVIIL